MSFLCKNQNTVAIGYSDNLGRFRMSPLNYHTNFIGYSNHFAISLG